MTRTLTQRPPTPTAEMPMQPSYALYLDMPSTEARSFIRGLFNLMQHYIVVADLRGATNKTGYRLQHGNSVCDFVYSFAAKNSRFHLQTQFKPGASNELAGRVLALVGLILSYHQHIGKPLNLNRDKTTLTDLKTLQKWGDWAVKQLYKRFPDKFPELAPAPNQAVKF